MFNKDINRSRKYVRMCSNCKKVHLSNNKWVEVEEYLVIFKKDRLPKITHGICPNCLKKTLKELQKLEI